MHETFAVEIAPPQGFSRGENKTMMQMGAPSPAHCPLYYSRDLRVILTGQREKDGKRWLHISVSKRGGKLPSYREMCVVKERFAGEDAIAYQVFAPKSEHVNLHEVLHLWVPLDGPVTPDFTWGMGTI